MTATLLLPVLLIAVAVGAVVFTVLSQLDERQMVRESLRQLDGYEVENQRDQQLLDPLKDRAIKPVLEGLTGLGKRFTPVGYVDKVRQKFVHMGNTSPQAVDRFLAVRAVTVVLASDGYPESPVTGQPISGQPSVASTVADGHFPRARASIASRR